MSTIYLISFEFLIYENLKIRRSWIFSNIRLPPLVVHCCLLLGSNSNKKPGIGKQGTHNGYLVIPMPGNLVTHKPQSKAPWLGAISFFILLLGLKHDVV